MTEQIGRYDVIESKVWRNTETGRTVSPYGAVPWYSEEGKKFWTLETRGWTVRDNVHGTVGIGRQPWKTREEAEAWVKEHK